MHLLTNNVYQRLISNPTLTAEETLELQKPMEEWYDGLPEYFKHPTSAHEPEYIAFARNRLRWRDWNLRTLVYRPILLRWASRSWMRNESPRDETPLEVDCRMRCLQNARLTLASISDFMNYHVCSRLAAWYMLYVCLFFTYLLEAIIVGLSLTIYFQVFPFSSWRNPYHIHHDRSHESRLAVLVAGC